MLHIHSLFLLMPSSILTLAALKHDAYSLLMALPNVERGNLYPERQKREKNYRGDAISNQPVKPIIAYRKYLWTHVCTHFNKSPVFVLNSIHFFLVFFNFFFFLTLMNLWTKNGLLEYYFTDYY